MKTDKNFVVFRTDGGSIIGSGHVMRCLALAESLMQRGWTCAFATTSETLESTPEIQNVTDDILLVSGDETKALIERWTDGCEWLVVDHYGRDSEFEASCRPWARHILVIDDLANRTHDCDLLMDSNPRRSDLHYRKLVPATCVVLLGPEYAPLRHVYAVRRRHLPRVVSDQPSRLLVSLGATPRPELVTDLLDGIAASKRKWSLDVVVGALSDRDTDWTNKLTSLNGTLHVATNDMARLIDCADIAIGAAGTSAWERCCLGLPTLLVVVADNQAENAGALVEAGAALLLASPITPDRVSMVLRALEDDIDLWRLMAAAALRMCDGLGAPRIVQAMESLRHTDNLRESHLHLATMDDAPIILDWQCNEVLRRFSRNPAVPSREEHMDWMRAKLGDPRCIFSIVVCGGRPAGVLRLDQFESTDAYEVSVLIAPEKHRTGLGKAALEYARNLVSDVDLWAFIHPNNGASIALFRSAGYAPAGRANWYVHSVLNENSCDPIRQVS